jgi:hypothetical protein
VEVKAEPVQVGWMFKIIPGTGREVFETQLGVQRPAPAQGELMTQSESIMPGLVIIIRVDASKQDAVKFCVARPECEIDRGDLIGENGKFMEAFADEIDQTDTIPFRAIGDIRPMEAFSGAGPTISTAEVTGLALSILLLPAIW